MTLGLREADCALVKSWAVYRYLSAWLRLRLRIWLRRYLSALIHLHTVSVRLDVSAKYITAAVVLQKLS